MSGIYRIVNTVSSKVYVGSSVNIEKRLKEHRRDLIINSHINFHLQSSWNKYGEENFIFEMIENCTEGNLVEREQHWIDHFSSRDAKLGYNQREAGNRGRHTEASKQKMRLKAYSRSPTTPETKEKLRQLNLGKRHTPENYSRIVEGNRLRSTSTEFRSKMSEIGKILKGTDEGKKKLAKMTEKAHSPEANNKRKETMRRIWSERKKLKEAATNGNK